MTQTTNPSPGVTIYHGPTADTPAANVPREQWPSLVRWRRTTAVRTLPDDCRALVFYIDDAAATGDWMGFGTREAYLREGLMILPDVADWALRGLAILPDGRGPVPMSEAVQLGKRGAQPGNDNAAKARTNQPDGHKVGKGYGTGAAYLTARLKRDAPEIAAKLHEYPSVAAAARAAGIPVAKSERVALGDPVELAAKITAKGAEYAAAVAAALTVARRPREEPVKKPSAAEALAPRPRVRSMALADLGDLMAPEGSKPWATAVLHNVIMRKRDMDGAVMIMQMALRMLREEDHFRVLADPDGRPFQSWEDFVQYPEPFGLGMRVAEAEAVLTARNGMESQTAQKPTQSIGKASR